MTTTDTQPITDPYTAMAVNYLFPAVSGDVEIRQFEVSPADSSRAVLTAMMHGRGYVWPGTYTALYRNGGLWMSNTPDEQRDHNAPVRHARGAQTALVGGLGIGMVIAGFLAVGVKHIDVVEIDADVIAVVGPQVQALAARYGATVNIHQGDMYAIKWPTGTCWDVAWFDIWEAMCGDNLPLMTKLARSYGRRTGWQGFWGREETIRYMKRRGW